ncbi:universal stress protein [Actinacidiphila alni]|uniref:universal stress protein n=1 Tax=Actinacidiphila alni TaxID=380248 RepID=UPI0033F19B44
MTRYVVAGVDGSAASVAALRWAAAEGEARGLALRVVTVIPRAHGPLGATSGSTTGRRVAAAVAEVRRGRPGLDVVAREIAGVPDRVLNDVGAGAELLVVATRGSGGFPGLRLGSVALGVASDAPCAVVLVPGESGGNGVPEVAVGVDGHHPDARALDLAFETARRREARLRAVGAWRLPAPYDEQVVMPVEEDRADWEDGELQLLEEALRGPREKYPSVAVLPDLRLFGPADALVRASGGADLLVVGRGEARTSRGLGGVAHAVAHHTRCPLLLAPRH